MSKIEITAGWSEAIAALLYNLIYDLTGEDEGAWNVKNRRDDAHYLAFAESLLKTIQGHPEASDEQAIALARAYAPSAYKRMTTGNPWAGSWSDTIVIDEQYSLLSSETKKHMDEIRGFMASPPVIAEEYEFILAEEIAAEEETPDLVAEQMERIESPGYNEPDEDDPLYVPPEERGHR